MEAVDEGGGGSPDRDPRPHPRGRPPHPPRRGPHGAPEPVAPAARPRVRPRAPRAASCGSFRAVEGFYIAGGIACRLGAARVRPRRHARGLPASPRGATRLVGAISVILVVAAIGLADLPLRQRGARGGRREQAALVPGLSRGPTDDGHAVHYTALERGTPVLSSDGEEVGKVVEVLDNYREHIFDGLVIETQRRRAPLRGRARGRRARPSGR